MAALSQSTGYAVVALAFISETPAKPWLVKAIADKCVLPAPYLSKVIHRLARAGLVHTQRGVHGGVSIARDPAQLTLMDVCVALDDPILEKRCMLGINTCSDERACLAHEFATGCRQRTLEFLQSTTIADIADQQADLHAEPAGDDAPAPAQQHNGTAHH